MSTTVNVVNNTVQVNLVDENITLDIVSGGLVPVADELSLVAGVNISALRAITTDGSGQAVYASNDTLANAQVIGITTVAATAGNNVTIKTSGVITDASWSWTKGAVYLGTNGQLTQTAPSGGAIIVHVGKALTATKLQVDIDTIITTV